MSATATIIAVNAQNDRRRKEEDAKSSDLSNAAKEARAAARLKELYAQYETENQQSRKGIEMQASTIGSISVAAHAAAHSVAHVSPHVTVETPAAHVAPEAMATHTAETIPAAVRAVNIATEQPGAAAMSVFANPKATPQPLINTQATQMVAPSAPESEEHDGHAILWILAGFAVAALVAALIEMTSPKKGR